MPSDPSEHLGWYRDLPDPRDYTAASGPVRDLLVGLARPPGSRSRAGSRIARAARVDWREAFPPAADVRDLAPGSAAAYACVGLAQGFERRAHGRLLDASARFAYKAARQLLRHGGDAGTPLRATLAAIARFGLPPASLCPDDPARFDDPLDPILFGFRDHSRPLRYVRLDPIGCPPVAVLARVKAWLAAGFTSAFGFVVFDSITDAAPIACPSDLDAPRGAMAAVAVGFDDGLRIHSTRGALLIRNAWGTGWGEAGYGWLPYAYVERGLAADFWTLLRADWLATGEFHHPGEL